MKVRREKTLAFFVGICMVMTLCMAGFVTKVDATGPIVETGLISQDEDIWHYITIPEGPEVEIKLMWEDPKHYVVDIDFAVGGVAFPWPNPWIGGAFRNPEIAYLDNIDDDTLIIILVNGWTVPVDEVAYRLEVTYGSDVIPDPYAESGGQTVGDLTSFHVAARAGMWNSDKQGANNMFGESNPCRQCIMPFVSFYNFYLSKIYFGLYEYGGWAGPAYYADDPLMVGGLAWYWPIDEYTRAEAKAEMEALNIHLKIDGIPLEDLGVVIEQEIKMDLISREYYYRYPAAIFKPGELYDVLPFSPDGLHTLQFYEFGIEYTFDFYLL